MTASVQSKPISSNVSYSQKYLAGIKFGGPQVFSQLFLHVQSGNLGISLHSLVPHCHCKHLVDANLLVEKETAKMNYPPFSGYEPQGHTQTTLGRTH